MERLNSGLLKSHSLRHSKLEQRLNSIALAHYTGAASVVSGPRSRASSCGSPHGGGSTTRTVTPQSGRRLSTSTPLGRRSSQSRSPTPRHSFRPFAEWEDDELQRQGNAFEYVEDDEDDDRETLVPFFGTRGWENTPPDVKANPDGVLSFVEDNWFRFMVGVVIMANLILLGLGLVKPELMWLQDATADAFLLLYVIELLLRIFHYKLEFFTWWPDAPWNWIDFLIVVGGMLDQWLLPLVNTDSGDFPLLGLRLFRGVRILVRLVRFLRVIRFLRILLHADPGWINSTSFYSVTCGVIFLNMIIIGLETDLPSPAWWWMEQAMLVFFAVELMFRLRFQLCAFFTDREDRAWNMLDLFIVVSCVLGQCVADSQQTARGSGHLATCLAVIRMGRMLRMLRLSRWGKHGRPLRELIAGILQAMQSMVWVLLLTFVLIYALAIMTTRMVGWGELVSDPSSIPEETREMFATLADSMFALFALMNGHQWQMVIPLLDMLPWTKPLFITFTICGSWALLSVMTGVVSDHINCVREKHSREHQEAQEGRRVQLTANLSTIFAGADKDGTGKLSRDEFLEIFKSPYHLKRLQAALNLPISDVLLVFDWLDMEGQGSVCLAEFCDGLDCLEEKVTGRRLLNLDCGVKRQCMLLKQGLDGVSGDLGMLRRDMELKHKQLMDRIQAVLGPKMSDGFWGRSPSHLSQVAWLDSQEGNPSDSLMRSASGSGLGTLGGETPDTLNTAAVRLQKSTSGVSGGSGRRSPQHMLLSQRSGSAHMLLSQGSQGSELGRSRARLHSPHEPRSHSKDDKTSSPLRSASRTSGTGSPETSPEQGSANTSPDQSPERADMVSPQISPKTSSAEPGPARRFAAQRTLSSLRSKSSQQRRFQEGQKSVSFSALEV